MPRRVLLSLDLSDVERGELAALAARPKKAQALALRARIVLACAEGERNEDVAARLQVDKVTVGKGRHERWPALSGQVSAVDKWKLCRLGSWAAGFGVARREGVARPE